jgi:hypothetical protein
LFDLLSRRGSKDDEQENMKELMVVSIRKTRRKNGQRGSGLVETALVLLSMMAMVIFIMDMGRILLVQQYTSERARVTVRNAVVNNWFTIPQPHLTEAVPGIWGC